MAESTLMSGSADPGLHPGCLPSRCTQRSKVSGGCGQMHEALTVLSVQQDFEAVGLVVVERLPDLVDGLLVRQLSVHKTGKETGEMRPRQRLFHRLFFLQP